MLKGARRLLQTSVRCVLSEAGLLSSDVEHTPFEQLYDYLRPLGFQLRGIYGTPYHADFRMKYVNALFVRDNSVKTV